MAMHSHSTDHPQLDLLGGADARPAELHRLFFALLPNEVTRGELARTAAALRASHPGLRARWVHPARYHATLHFLGNYAMLRQDVVEVAVLAADGLSAPAFEWLLRGAVSFRGRQPPCVLRGSSVPEPLQPLWQNLRQVLTLAGQGRYLERSFTPHVTVAYSQRELLDDTPIEPVRWMIDEFALIHSVVGQPDYQVLARWPLAAAG
jgi:2'-5' RNA ligase